jgi:hypothetical protein
LCSNNRFLACCTYRNTVAAVEPEGVPQINGIRIPAPSTGRLYRDMASCTPVPAAAMTAPVPLLGSMHRVAVTALALLPLLLVTICSIPALTILPFLPGGPDRVNVLITRLSAWTRIILTLPAARPRA